MHQPPEDNAMTEKNTEQPASDNAGRLDAVVSLQGCNTPAEIERWFQRAIKNKPLKRLDQERKACNERAMQIAGTLRHGHLLAVRLDKGQGASRRYLVDGEEYKTGTWGNGAGYRYAMAYWEKWYEKKLRAGGLRSPDKIRAIISWTREEYLWRSLRLLVS